MDIHAERQRSLTAAEGIVIGYRVLRGAQPRPVLVMLHGLASNLTRWSEFVAHTELKSDWDLLRLDLRGHGTSLTRSAIDRTRWCADIAAVLQQEGYAQAVIVGHSLGAQVAIEYARRHPEQVIGLVLIDPVFPEALRGMLLSARRLRPLLWLMIRALRLLNALGLRRRHIPPRDLHALDVKTRAALAAAPELRIADLYMSPLEDLRYVPLVVYLQDLYETTRRLPAPEEIHAPVLVLLSAGAAVTEGDMTRRFIERFPCHSTVIVAADHWLLTERPEEARHAIERWCTSVFPS